MVIAYAPGPAGDLKRKIKPALTAARHTTLGGSQLRKTERREAETRATIMMERKRETDADDEIRRRGCCSREKATVS